eukprot:jgi/Bigna1/145420/aug1.99_g20128
MRRYLSFPAVHKISLSFGIAALLGLLILQLPQGGSYILGINPSTGRVPSPEVRKQLDLPPGRVGAIGLRETAAYMKDGEGYLKERVEMHGPVFKTGLFFRPTVMVGSKAAVRDFLPVEPSVSESSLPPSFVQLHTPYSALNQKGDQLKATRAVYSEILGKEALLSYWPQIRANMVQSVEDGLAASSNGDNIMTPIRDGVLGLYFQLWMGLNVNDRNKKLFTDFNAGLLSPMPINLPWTAFGKAMRARETICAETKALIESHIRDGKNQGFDLFTKVLSQARDESGKPWSTHRMSIVSLLFVWGAYEETAAVITNTLRLLSLHPEYVPKIRKELEEFAPNGVGEASLKDLASMSFLRACVKEGIRLIPPSGGGMRVTTQDIELAGYRIPKGWVVTADPRIANKQEDIFGTDIDSYNPERFIQKRFTSNEFFPGGIGSHACPGIEMSELVSMTYLASFMENFSSWEQTAGTSLAWSYIPFQVMTNFQVNLKRRTFP